jgi:hypothetical protein
MNTPYDLFADEGILKSGWASFVQPLVDECKEKGYQISQIKEKYGTLRFYGDFPNDFYLKVERAEKLSGTTCIQCGQPGKTYYIGWFLTLCPEHAEKHYGDSLLGYVDPREIE